MEPEHCEYFIGVLWVLFPSSLLAGLSSYPSARRREQHLLTVGELEVQVHHSVSVNTGQSGKGSLLTPFPYQALSVWEGQGHLVNAPRLAANIKGSGGVSLITACHQSTRTQPGDEGASHYCWVGLEVRHLHVRAPCYCPDDTVQCGAWNLGKSEI